MKPVFCSQKTTGRSSQQPGSQRFQSKEGINAECFYLEEKMEERLEAGNLSVHRSGLEAEVRRLLKCKWRVHRQADLRYRTPHNRTPQVTVKHPLQSR